MAARARPGPHRRGDEPPGLVIEQIGSAQDGRVARWQLLERGVTRHEIDGRIRSSLLIPEIEGVFAVGHRTRTPRSNVQVRVLAAGPTAAATAGSAAWLRSLLRYPPSLTRIVVRDRSPHRIPGALVHRPSTLEDHDIEVVDGITMTTIARMLLDLAATAPKLVRPAVGQAERLGLLDMRQVDELLGRVSRPRNVRVLYAALEDPGLPARSSLEEVGHEIAREAAVPDPEANAMVEVRPGVWYEVDLLWRAERLIVEIDGSATHRGRLVLLDDARKVEECTAAGFAVIRAPEARLAGARAAFAANLNRAWWTRHREHVLRAS